MITYLDLEDIHYICVMKLGYYIIIFCILVIFITIAHLLSKLIATLVCMLLDKIKPN